MKAIKVLPESGNVMYIEVSENIEVVGSGFGGGRISGGGETAANMMEKIEAIGTTIAEVCGTVQQHVLKRMGSLKPNDLTLEFGVKLAGEAGIPLVTKGSAEGTFKVKAKWNFPNKNEGENNV
jgi:Trypsin-co-occurring domain 1